jgi:hypothetical protein
VSLLPLLGALFVGLLVGLLFPPLLGVLPLPLQAASMESASAITSASATSFFIYFSSDFVLK